MSFTKKEIEFGVLKQKDKDRLAIYDNRTNFRYIYAGDIITDFRLVGNDVIVNLKNGKTKRFTGPTSYEYVY